MDTQRQDIVMGEMTTTMMMATRANNIIYKNKLRTDRVAEKNLRRSNINAGKIPNMIIIILLLLCPHKKVYSVKEWSPRGEWGHRDRGSG